MIGAVRRGQRPLRLGAADSLTLGSISRSRTQIGDANALQLKIDECAKVNQAIKRQDTTKPRGSDPVQDALADQLQAMPGVSRW